MTCKILRLEEVDSTNSYLKQLISDGDSGLCEGLTVAAVAQTAGRGQRGNSWEADPGMNITLSMLISPKGIAPDRQFAISEAVALSVADTVDSFLPEGLKAEVKWPNDIYVGDRKVAGILIEHSLCGAELLWSVAGIGLNVNQPLWRSDAPNPVALCELVGHELSLDSVEIKLIERLEFYISHYLHTYPALAPELHEMYMDRLWRHVGSHAWLDHLTGETIFASIHSVAPTGHLTLSLPDSTQRTYAFKEVSPLF